MSDKNSLKQENYLHKIQGKPIPDAPPTWKDDMTPVKTIAPTKKKKRKGTNTKLKLTTRRQKIVILNKK